MIVWQKYIYVIDHSNTLKEEIFLIISIGRREKH